MCSSCGGGKAAARLPGATPRNPVVFGAVDGVPAQPATFLVEHDKSKPGQYKYVAGDGVAQAVDDGIIEIGYRSKATNRERRAPKVSKAPEFYVKTGNNRWVGFTSQVAAEKYAKTVNGVFQTRDEVLKLKTGSAE